MILKSATKLLKKKIQIKIFIKSATTYQDIKFYTLNMLTKWKWFSQLVGFMLVLKSCEGFLMFLE